jgi:uncharacterized membrane protein (UPF0182 family)
MSRIFVVSSGRFDEFTGATNWLTLRAFTNGEDAEVWIASEIKRDPSFNEDLDFYDIDEVPLYGSL